MMIERERPFLVTLSCHALVRNVWPAPVDRKEHEHKQCRMPLHRNESSRKLETLRMRRVCIFFHNAEFEAHTHAVIWNRL